MSQSDWVYRAKSVAAPTDSKVMTRGLLLFVSPGASPARSYPMDSAMTLTQVSMVLMAAATSPTATSATR